MSSFSGSSHDDSSDGLPRYCLLFCPFCHTQHLDEGEWLERPHHKHLCLHCKKLWRVDPFCFGVADPQSDNSPTDPWPFGIPLETDPRLRKQRAKNRLSKKANSSKSKR